MDHTMLLPGWQGHQARASSTAPLGTVMKLVLWSCHSGSFSSFTLIHLKKKQFSPGTAYVELEAQKLEQ